MANDATLSRRRKMFPRSWRETNIPPARGVFPPTGEIFRLPQGESCAETLTHKGGVAI
jgi:hypothetical protein